MAYSRELYKRASEEIKRRKTQAEYTAQQHKNELNVKYPEFQFIESELAKTGMEIVAIFGTRDNVQERLAAIRAKNTSLRNERKKLLKALGLPEDYLDVKYTCEICQDSGYIEERDDERGVSYGTKYCSCHKDLLKKYASEKMSKATPMELSSFEDFDLSYYPRQVGSNGESPYEAMKFVYENCKNYVDDFDLESNNLYFYGRTGLGKTHLSLAIANEVMKKGYNVVYGSVITFLNKLEREKFGRTETYETEDALVDADLLILDDLGAEFTTPVAVSCLYNILNCRIARRVPTIISSNLSVEEIKNRYPESIASRIIGNFKTVEFIGKDIRQIQNDE
ncbi:MAG: ATP-binding protein [Clostridia bacterium]|nr:ATP-binding protein [Clostridia bacterium]